MHELAVAKHLLEIALRHAQAANARQITTLYLAIGQLSSVFDESVAFYWDLIAKDTLAEGARLDFRRIPGRLRCTACDQQYSLSHNELSCPACGGASIKILSGEEFFLEAIDVEN